MNILPLYRQIQPPIPRPGIILHNIDEIVEKANNIYNIYTIYFLWGNNTIPSYHPQSTSLSPYQLHSSTQVYTDLRSGAYPITRPLQRTRNGRVDGKGKWSPFITSIPSRGASPCENLLSPVRVARAKKQALYSTGVDTPPKKPTTDRTQMSIIPTKQKIRHPPWLQGSVQLGSGEDELPVRSYPTISCLTMGVGKR